MRFCVTDMTIFYTKNAGICHADTLLGIRSEDRSLRSLKDNRLKCFCLIADGRFVFLLSA